MGFFSGCDTGVHRFEARYDKGPAKIKGVDFAGFGDLETVLEKLRRVTYVRDICVRCGRVIERYERVYIEQKPITDEDLKHALDAARNLGGGLGEQKP